MEELIVKLTRALKSGTPAERKIARYIMEHLAEMPFETPLTIASRLKLSSMTVGRFLRSMGYQEFGDMRKDLRESDDRRNAATQQPAGASPMPVLPGRGLEQGIVLEDMDKPRRSLASVMVQQIRIIQGVYELASQPVWESAVELMMSRPEAFVASSGDASGIARYFQARLLEYRRNVRYIENMSTTSLALFDSKPEDALLILVDSGEKAAPLLNLCRAARKERYKTLLITTRYYEWGPDSADICLYLPLDTDARRNELVQVISILEFLLYSAGSAPDGRPDERLRRMHELQRRFDG